MEENNIGMTTVESTQLPEGGVVNTTSGQADQIDINTQVFLNPIKKEEELSELKGDFKDFVKTLPRKLKRKVYAEKKFGNQLEIRQREKRLAQLNKR